MTGQKLEVVQRVWDAAEARDTATVLSLYADDAELDVSGFPLVDTSETLYTGHDGLRRLFAEWREVWDEAESELLEVIDAGDQVITVYRYRGRGRRSGLPVDETFATLWTVEAGKVSSVKWFVRREDALRAANHG